MGHAEHGYGYYVKIWAILMVLLIISIIGPTLEILVVTLITAFGVALVKALMVAAYFMHLNIEKKYIWLLLIGALLFLAALYIGLAPDIQNTTGVNWKRCNAYSDAARARLAAETKIAEEHHPGIEHLGFINADVDCTPQRWNWTPGFHFGG
jgi:caa(3)-type oxidase subunit IV